jgi:putative oxidoreductase
MSALLEVRRKVGEALARFEVVGRLLARLSVGVMFAQSGWGKLNDLDTVVEFFTTLGIPYPELQAPFVAGVEFGGGLLVTFGLFTRLAAVPLMITMFVAMATALRDQIGSVADLLALSEFTYFAVLGWLALGGPGAVSLDALLVRVIGGAPAAAQPGGARAAAA